MIAIDDLRAEFGASFGSPEVFTPHIDALAKSAVVFPRNFCQAATCGISRSSLLTSRRPDTTRVLTNGGCPFRTSPQHANWVSLPAHFRNEGFTTQGTDLCVGRVCTLCARDLLLISGGAVFHKAWARYFIQVSAMGWQRGRINAPGASLITTSRLLTPQAHASRRAATAPASLVPLEAQGARVQMDRF
jgi:hypothetical protein